MFIGIIKLIDWKIKIVLKEKYIYIYLISRIILYKNL